MAGGAAPMSDPVVEIAFTAPLIEWRGPAPFYFLALPEDQVGEVHYGARLASYGWGCVPVEAEIDGTVFTTSLFPRDGGYMLPVKAAVRKATGLALGDKAAVTMRIYPR